MGMSIRVWVVFFVAIARVALADPEPTPPAPTIKLGGYLELDDSWNFRRPSNGINNLRGFDDRHATLTLQNAVLEATWTKGPVSGRIALQAGEAPDNYYYVVEPTRPPSGTAPASGPSDWRHIQEAWAAWQVSCALELAAGLFLSPIGPEVLQTRDDWNWSRSNLYHSFPYYHVGVRAKGPLRDSGWSLIGGVYNGWSNAVDNNEEPSVSVAAAYAKGAWTAQVLYFGGVERSTGAPEGSPWRHLGDAYVQGPIVGKLSFLAHGDAGFERGMLGTSSWGAFAGYLRYDVASDVYVAARGDVVREWKSMASAILIPVEWVSSGTATVSWRPADGLDLRFEYRHDSAQDYAYFGGAVITDPVTGMAVPNRKDQDTVTAGAIAWF